MSVLIHPSSQRGHVKNDWLDTHYSFSFSDYYHPARMGFGRLLVVNDDAIAPAQGFGKHPYHDMEIITLVHQGILSHEDSMGNKGTINEGEVQVMSAGTGILHAEYNASTKEPVQLFQIWIETAKKSGKPRYEQKNVDWTHKPLQVIVSGKKHEGLFIQQEATILAGTLKKGEEYHYSLKPGRGLFIMNVQGILQINGHTIQPRDSAEITKEKQVTITATKESLLFIIDVNINED